jgi:hypothetical protein
MRLQCVHGVSSRVVGKLHAAVLQISSKEAVSCVSDLLPDPMVESG